MRLGSRLLAVAFVLAAFVAVGGCGSESSETAPTHDENSYAPLPRQARTPPGDPNEWTCSDFDNATDDRRDQAIAELAGSAQLKGRGSEILAEIRSICAASSEDYTPAIKAVDKVAARNTPKLDQSSDDSGLGDAGSGGGPTEPPPDPNRSEPNEVQPPSAPPHREPYCDEADAPDRLAPGCQGTLVPR